MGKRYELVAGELRSMSPSGWSHGRVVGKLHNRLGHFIEQCDLGMVFGAETGFRLAANPDTVRAPDFAFVAKQNIPAKLPREAFWPGAPDLAVEVLSPNDSTGEVDEKISAWLAAGCAAVWVIDPKLETVTIYHSRTDVKVVTPGGAGRWLSCARLLLPSGRAVSVGRVCPSAEGFASHIRRTFQCSLANQRLSA